MELFQKTSIQSTTPLCHWIVNEEVLVLYMTIFNDWHCEYDRPWCCIFWVKISRWKMTISHEVEWSWSRLKMFRDHNNIVEKGASVRFERGDLFLSQTLDLFVRWTIHAKCNNSSLLLNSETRIVIYYVLPSSGCVLASSLELWLLRYDDLLYFAWFVHRANKSSVCNRNNTPRLNLALASFSSILL